MAAERYRADSENGDHVADPSARTLTRLIATLDLADNTFVVIQPDDEDPDWFTSVVLLDPHTYEVERRDQRTSEHGKATMTNPATIAHDLTTWMTSRDLPDQPPRPTHFQNTP
ncbi:hypothetical protein I6A84_00045 [Frankia sp. CNm7]|uniref:Uncharacterized protein n=1 Tax=Frankia nepalensis TaxID=1836974 RepID=A0A937REA4_9ACTN|nr:hypothetical protein [Frankia nepalensis]MBL7502542.1 hypothetical protein [Frankia nepalensis]MBL7516517.1 hypothetical protein [Frankia nepalensis]MBL7516554.1 hypothetical protein [Frankia nepalensis]MBL7625854.1 hypothetical protein [Frankia nepalensis]